MDAATARQLPSWHFADGGHPTCQIIGLWPWKPDPATETARRQTMAPCSSSFKKNSNITPLGLAADQG